MIRVHPSHRDALAAAVAATAALVEANNQPVTLDPREALEVETARRVASFTFKLCAAEVS